MGNNIEKYLQNLVNTEYDEMKNLGTFTSNYCHPFVKKNLLRYLNKNLVDKKGYSSLKLYEDTIDTFIKDLYGNSKTITTSGSTESILLSFYYARENALHEKGITRPNIVLPEHAHYSLFKCAKMLHIETRMIGVNDQFTIYTDSAEIAVDQNTILIVGVMGSTELGVIDDLETLNVIAEKHKTFLHVDAAIGGFIIPFLGTPIKHTFTQLPQLFSMNMSGHKFGLGLLGCGLLLLRDENIIKKYTDHVAYLSSGKNRIESLTFSASPLGAFSLAINILHFEKKGYRQNALSYLKTKETLKAQLDKMHIDYFEGSIYIPQLFLSGKNILELSQFLLKKGWLQNTYEAKNFYKQGIRLVIKKGQEKLYLEDFIQDTKTFYKEKKSKDTIQVSNKVFAPTFPFPDKQEILI